MVCSTFHCARAAGEERGGRVPLVFDVEKENERTELKNEGEELVEIQVREDKLTGEDG